MSRTRIFARPTYADQQAIVYQMQFSAAEALAMILPLPVRSGAAPDEVRFINLEAYPRFFEDMSRGFVKPVAAPADPFLASYGGSRSKLEVVPVGSFEASFVPTVDDFDRLDRRFRIEAGVWRSLPGYDAMGFAVFKLKPGRQEVHPMGLSFPRRDTGQLFFPTLHIHDGEVHEVDEFDHELFAQGNTDQHPDTAGWEESAQWAGQFMDTKLTGALLHNGAHVYRRSLRGELPNRDTLVALS